MRSLIAISLLAFLFSCSDDQDCSSKKKEINEYYDEQVNKVKEMGENSQTGIDYEQIALINQERNNKLDKACD